MIDPRMLFFTKLGSAVLALILWVGLVVTKNDVTQQQLDLILYCKSYLAGMVGHLAATKIGQKGGADVQV